MLVNPEYHKISIVKYYQEILQTIMLELCVFISSSLNLVYMQVISYI